MSLRKVKAGGSGITLTRESTTNIYVDATSQEYPWVYWLAVPGTQPPASMMLEEAWDQNLGYVLFLDAKPTSYSTLEQDLKSHVKPPKNHTGFGWIHTQDVSSQWVIQINSQETVETEVLIAPGSSLPNLDIKAETPVILAASLTTGIAEIQMTSPPVPAYQNQPPSQHLSRPGVVVPVTGNELGAACFQQLKPFPEDLQVQPDNSKIVPLWNVIYDPLRPSRIATSYTGVQIKLSETGGVFAIEGT